LEIPTTIAALFAFVLGCVVGSFLNVCIYRMPRDRSVVAPPSHCPQCGARLEARDLIPVLSFLALGRKCRRCGGAISWRYALVELLTGAVFLAVLKAYGPTWYVLPAWVFAAVLIAVVFTDLDHMIIPDKLVLAGVAAGVLGEGLLVANGGPLLSVKIPWTDLHLPRVVAGGILGLVVFYLMRGFSQLLFRREGMGLGDVKLAGAIGAMLGPGLALLSFGLAVAVGAVLGVLLMVLRLRRRMEYLPFGPFLAVAALLALLAPQGVVAVARAMYEKWLALSGIT
jgi:leader peptidase (prepilin peptidase)/N-methyltransferase